MNDDGQTRYAISIIPRVPSTRFHQTVHKDVFRSHRDFRSVAEDYAQNRVSKLNQGDLVLVVDLDSGISCIFPVTEIITKPKVVLG